MNDEEGTPQQPESSDEDELDLDAVAGGINITPDIQAPSPGLINPPGYQPQFFQ